MSALPRYYVEINSDHKKDKFFIYDRQASSAENPVVRLSQDALVDRVLAFLNGQANGA